MQRIVLVRFNKWIKPEGFRKKVIAAEYTEEGWSGKVLLIPNNNSITPKENELCFVFLPEHYYSKIYYNGVNVFQVRIETPEIIGEAKVFKNIPISNLLFKNYTEYNSSKVVAILIYPDKRHETFFMRIRGNYNVAKIVRFLRKNLMGAEIKIINGTIRITMGKLEDSDYLKKGFWNKLSDFILNSSED